MRFPAFFFDFSDFSNFQIFRNFIVENFSILIFFFVFFAENQTAPMQNSVFTLKNRLKRLFRVFLTELV
jgi:hypothetical protein